MSSDNSAEMTTSTDAMAESIIGRLPKELSNKIYEFVMAADIVSRGRRRLGVTDHTSQQADSLTLRQRLAPLQVCREMRAEAMGYLFHNPVELIHQKGAVSDYHIMMTAPTDDELKTWSAEIARIPVHLRSRSMKFQYSYDCELNIFPPLAPELPERGPEFEAAVGALINAAQPHEVSVAINMYFHRMCTLGVLGCNSWMRQSKVVNVCVHDEPVTMADCESILVKIPTSNAARAYCVVQDAFAERRRRFEVHRSHRVCFVRLGLNVILEHLEMAEQTIHEVMENLPGFPKSA